MTPRSFYCALVERSWIWKGVPVARPRPEDRYPIWVVAGMTAVGAAILPAGLMLLERAGRAFYETRGGASLPWWLVTSAAALGGAVALGHWGMSAVFWNQSAARRKLGLPEDPQVSRRSARFWLLGALYLAGFGLALPVAVLVGIENLRGALAWAGARDQLSKLGEPTTLKQLLPPPATEAENLGSIRLFADQFDYTRAADQFDRTRAEPGGTVWRETNALVRSRLFRLPDSFLPERKEKVKGERPGPRETAEWAEAFRRAIQKLEDRKTASWKKRPAEDLPDYPAGALRETNDARLVLAALSVADPLLTEICAASERPRARFGIHYEDGPSTLLPHLATLKAISQHMNLRVVTRVEAGQADQAFAEMKCALRIADAAREEPFFISHLVRIAQFQIALNGVAAGAAAHAWTDAQWVELADWLSKVEFLNHGMTALQGERAASLDLLERWARDGKRFREELDFLNMDGSDSPQGIVAGNAGIALMPRGWIRQNQVSLAHVYQSTLVRLREATRKSATGSRWGEFMSHVEAEEKQQSTSPYSVFVNRLKPAYARFFWKSLRVTHAVRSAITQCALERFYLAHGRYPLALAELSPRYLATVTQDVLVDRPLQYAIAQDGSVRLWGVGADGVDDRGALGRDGNSDQPLDWVWPEKAWTRKE